MVGSRKGARFLVLAMAAGSILNATIAVPQAGFRRLFTLNPNGRIVVHNLYGDVRIRAWDRDDVLVTATKRSIDPKRLDAARIVVDSAADSISISTQYAGADAEHPASVEYQIMVPRNANLENVKVINGGLSLTGLAGPVKASSVNGGIKAEALEGEVDLSTINGRLEAAFHRVDTEKLICLSSVNGPIRLAIPSDSGASVEARNLSGGIESNAGQTWHGAGGYRMRLPGSKAGAQIRVHNVNGGISIRMGPRVRPWS